MKGNKILSRNVNQGMPVWGWVEPQRTIALGDATQGEKEKKDK